MKKIFLFVTICLISCEAIDELTQFDIDNQSEFTIAASTIINTPIIINTPDVTTNSNSEFSNNNTNSNLIESIKLKRLNLTVTSPTDGNFNFLKSIEIFINADGLSEIEIANIYDLENDDFNTINLNSTNVELREYLKKDTYTLRVQTVTDETIAQDYNVQVNSTFRVDAKILGI